MCTRKAASEGLGIRTIVVRSATKIQREYHQCLFSRQRQRLQEGSAYSGEKSGDPVGQFRRVGLEDPVEEVFRNSYRLHRGRFPKLRSVRKPSVRERKPPIRLTSDSLHVGGRGAKSPRSTGSEPCPKILVPVVRDIAGFAKHVQNGERAECSTPRLLAIVRIARSYDRAESEAASQRPQRQSCQHLSR